MTTGMSRSQPRAKTMETVASSKYCCVNLAYSLFNVFFYLLSPRPPLTLQTPPVPTLQILTPSNLCLLSLLSALSRTLVLLEWRTRRARVIAELLTLLTAGGSLEEAEETGEKEEVVEEDMELMRFLRLCWRTWPSSGCLRQTAAGTVESLRTPANTETDM